MSKRSAAAQAHAFATEFAVWKWVDEQNCCTGLAPSVADVVQRRNLCLDETAAGVWGEFTAAPEQEGSCQLQVGGSLEARLGLGVREGVAARGDPHPDDPDEGS